jgi:hypothetical protein
MKRVAILLALGLCACGNESKTAVQRAPAQAVVPAPAAQSMVAGKLAATKAEMIMVPADKQQLARLLALGYTVHEDHLHPPGVKNCPFDMGGGVVQ